MVTNRIRYFLIPFLLSDGGISPHGRNSWVIYFRNNDQSLLDEFKRVYEKTTKTSINLQKRKDNSYMLRARNKEVGDCLVNLTNTFRTKKCNEYPICSFLNGNRKPCLKCFVKQNYPKPIIPEIFFKNRQYMKYFLRIYFSCDGGVSVTVTKTKYPFLVRKVFVSVFNPYLKKQILDMLKSLGFSPKEYSGQIRLTCEDDIKRFANQIGFVDNCKIGKDSKVFEGFEKNKLLNERIDSYKNPREFIKSYF